MKPIIYIVEVSTAAGEWIPSLEVHYVKRCAKKSIAPLVAVLPGRYRVRKYVRAK